MAKTPRTKLTSPYKTVGRTYDGVKVLAPKTKSKTFTAAQVRRVIEKALEEVAGAAPKQALRDSDALRVEKRDDGRYQVKRHGGKRASAVTDIRFHSARPGSRLWTGS